MHQRFVISDHHFLQDSIYNFSRHDGSPIRPWAKTAEEGDEMMIAAHNDTVRQCDTTYFLGDVAIKAIGIKYLARMNGRKILIRGNHDIFRLKQYTEHFADIRGTHKIDRLIMSHYPIHRRSIPKWCIANVHGHTHASVVQKRTWWGARRDDPLYVNVCVEQVPDLKPLAIDDLIARLKA